MRPTLLPPNPVPRFYLGGPRISALRGIELDGDRVPEEWVGSTTTVLGEPTLGLSRLDDGTLLRDVIAAAPQDWLGAAHVARWGAEPRLLVKLLDAGERLPIHLHPDDTFARTHMTGQRWGKTEAWIIAGGEGEVHLGWRDDVPAEQVRAWVEAQDTAAMLGAMHRLAVRAGDALFVPAGVAHAIGEGVLIVELQQPSDLGVMLEHAPFDVGGADGATMGLGWDVALTAVELGATDPMALEGPGDRLLPRAADPFFRADRLAAGDLVDAGFAILVVLAGAGTAGDLPLRRGDVAVVPHAAGDWGLDGDLDVLCCRPSRP